MNLLEYTDYQDFKKKTGLPDRAAIEFLLDKLSTLKKQQGRTGGVNNG